MRSSSLAIVVVVLGCLVLENLTDAQTQEEGKPLGNLTSGEIAKVQVSFEFSKNALDLLSDPLSSTIKAFHTLSELSKAQKALKAVTLVIKAIGPVMKMLQVAGAIFEVLSVFFLPSVEDILKKEFGKVNEKLDALSLQLQNVGEELESNMEFQSWFPLYTEYKFKIMNGEKKLTQTMSQMKAATDHRQKLRSVKEYTDYYKYQDIEGAMRNIFRLTARDSTTTQPNLFQLYTNKHDCNIEGLSQFTLAVLSLTYSGSKQMSAFSFLANNKQADESLKYVNAEIENVKHQFENQVWSCFESAIRRAKKKTSDIMVGNPEMTGTHLSTKIYSELFDLAPWYKWSVVHYKQLLDFRQIWLPPDEERCVTRVDILRSHQIFFEKHSDRNILVTWEGENTKSHGCHEIRNAKTFVPFQLCEKCNADALQTSKDTLTGERCPDYIQSTYSQLCRDPNGLISRELSKYTFVAAGFEHGNHACQENTCRGHGSCRVIPYTKHHMCFCHQYFFGPNCETRYNPTDSLLARDVIASVRNNFRNFIGAPDVTDVYFELKKMPTQLQRLQNNLEGLHYYNSILIMYGNDFAKAELVAEKYSHLLSGKISEDKFGRYLAQRNFQFEDIFRNLKIMILGEGKLTPVDLLTALKMSQRTRIVCKKRYNKKISRFMKELLTLDEQVTEAQLRFLSWKLSDKDPSEMQNPFLQMGHIRDMAVARQWDYLQHWEKTSCPELSAANLVENGCTKSLSYKGLNVMLHCHYGMTPSVQSVTCRRVNGRLEWSAQPFCQYAWNTWGSWSICSKTCGVGLRRRYRYKMNRETDVETQNCETEKCCEERDGNFKCNNGQCVPYNVVCDGILNCADGSDESEARQCNYLRDGDTVSLKNGCDGFLSCCETFLLSNDIVTISGCPGDSVDSLDFTRCPGIEFRVDLINKGRHRGPIRFGDEITITSRRSGICINCQDHSYYGMLFRTGRGNVCRATNGKTSTCKTKIFAKNRQGSCSGDVSRNCKGDPIRHEDVLYLQQGNTWMSADGVDTWVYRRTCPGSSITPQTPCRCEQWTVFRR